jgi:hypothetical protein
MRRKTFIHALSCLCVVLMACGTAFAQQGKMQSGPYNGPMAPMVSSDAPDAAPFFTNLEANACTGCNYSADNGFLVLGPSNCYVPTAGATQWLAYPFVSKKTGAVRKVQLAVTQDSALCTSTSTRFTVAIYTDACTNAPGTQIGSAVVAAAPAAPCALANANFGAAGVSLTVNTKYWVVVTTDSSPQQIGTTAVWWEVNAAADSFNLNDGNGWVFGPLGGPGAFTVQ